MSSDGLPTVDATHPSTAADGPVPAPATSGPGSGDTAARGEDAGAGADADGAADGHRGSSSTASEPRGPLSGPAIAPDDGADGDHHADAATLADDGAGAVLATPACDGGSSHAGAEPAERCISHHGTALDAQEHASIDGGPRAADNQAPPAPDSGASGMLFPPEQPPVEAPCTPGDATSGTANPCDAPAAHTEAARAPAAADAMPTPSSASELPEPLSPLPPSQPPGASGTTDVRNVPAVEPRSIGAMDMGEFGRSDSRWNEVASPPEGGKSVEPCSELSYRSLSGATITINPDRRLLERMAGAPRRTSVSLHVAHDDAGNIGEVRLSISPPSALVASAAAASDRRLKKHVKVYKCVLVVRGPACGVALSARCGHAQIRDFAGLEVPYCVGYFHLDRRAVNGLCGTVGNRLRLAYAAGI